LGRSEDATGFDAGLRSGLTGQGVRVGLDVVIDGIGIQVLRRSIQVGLGGGHAALKVRVSHFS
jgi:hypothetical protein